MKYLRILEFVGKYSCVLTTGETQRGKRKLRENFKSAGTGQHQEGEL